ncbi:branched-chain amino acid ABC transporter permease [Methylobacterium platani]|uniref:Branched-chain amino acid ABC transporter permease n=2 Tax=Methylobacterium platani TaxID=427683 RepID=A0A179SDV9_9HYPH|nr:branched-chain amino acid ABC transporter permease [Methylobacterium platani]KMO13537.1 branched-chain amino acid ABC transporter permease [Methylobacterium platani JCM 14648]OAS25057.1 branched-chain amino acid ABC transporter permease [Methylobacterium platani]
MDFLFSLLIAGVSVGSAYALVAIGLNMTFWTTRTLNFGQGSLMMLCAMLTAFFASQGVWLALAVVAGLAVVGLLGIFIERFAVRPALKTEGSMGWMVATLGFGTLLQGIAAKYFGSQAVAFPEVVFSASDTVTIFGQPAALQYLVIFVLAVGLVALLELFLGKTIWGQVIRAVSFDQELGRVQGMPVGAIILLSFVASSVLAGVAGMLIAQIGGTVDPAFGFDLVLLGFVSAVLGGMGSSVGALVGGIVVGVLSKLVGGYISTAAEHGIAFALLMVMLAVRPQGLFARPEAVKV